MNVSCQSAGWYPQPQLRWADQKQDLRPKYLNYSNASSGLVSVHSWLLVPSSSEVSCSVEGKVAKVHLGNPPQPAGTELPTCVKAFNLFVLCTLNDTESLFAFRFGFFSWMGGLHSTAHIHTSFSWAAVLQEER